MKRLMKNFAILVALFLFLGTVGLDVQAAAALDTGELLNTASITTDEEEGPDLGGDEQPPAGPQDPGEPGAPDEPGEPDEPGDPQPGDPISLEYAEDPSPWMYGLARRSMSLLSSGTPSSRVVDPNQVAEDQLQAGQVRMTKTAIPVYGLVNTWNVVLRVAGRPEQVSSDIVLVIDVSGSMGDRIPGKQQNRLYYTKLAAKNFVTTVLNADSQNTRISIVSFSGHNSEGSGNTATTQQALTNNASALHQAIDGLKVAGSGIQYTHTQSGIAQARSVLDTSSATKKTIVLFSDGLPNRNFSINTPTAADFYSGSTPAQRLSRKDLLQTRFNYGDSVANTRSVTIDGTSYLYSSPNAAIAEGRIARAAGYTVYAIGMYAGNDGQATLLEIADTGKSYASDADGLDGVFQQIAGQLGSPVSTATITDPMASGFVIADTSSITKTSGTVAYDGATDTLTWSFPLLSQSGAGDTKFEQLAYRIEITDDTPYVSGNTLLPTNGTTPMSFTDVEGKSSVNNFPIPQVDPVFVTLDKVVKDGGGTTISSSRDFTINLNSVDYVIKADDPVKVIKRVWSADTYQVTETAEPDYMTSYLVNGVATQELTLAQAGLDQNVLITNQEKRLEPVDVVIAGTKRLIGRGLGNREFYFHLHNSNATGVLGSMIEAVANVGTNFAFTALTFADGDEGTYYYLVKEATGSYGGVHFDDTRYLVKVVIADDGAGRLIAAVTYMVYQAETSEWVTVNGAAFTNIYTAAGSFTPSVKKVLSGRDLKANDFSFVWEELESGSDPEVWHEVETQKNLADGSIPFSAIEYSLADIGVHSYRIREEASGLAGMTDDKLVVNYVVTVSDKGNGTLNVIYTPPQDTIFNNTYEAEGIDIDLGGIKKLTGRSLAQGEFSFSLYASDAAGLQGSLMETVTNDGGYFSFTPLTFGPGDEGSYYYLIKEVAGSLTNVTYDLTEYLVKVVIADNLAGAMQLEELRYMVIGSPAEEGWPEAETAVFHNRYLPPPPPPVLVPDLAVEKLVAETVFSQAGDELHYSVRIKNTGDLAFVKLTINDARLGIANLEIDLSANPLLPGETYLHVFTAAYIVTAADVDAAVPIINTLTVKGETAAGRQAEDSDHALVAFEQTAPAIPPMIKLEKLAQETKFTKAGNLIHYYFTLTNEGVVAVVKLTVNDPKLGIDKLIIDLTDDPLLPGESFTYEFSQTYRVTRADLDAGKITNVLTVTGESPDGLKDEATDDLILPYEQILPLPPTGEYSNHRIGTAALLVGGALAIILIIRRRRLQIQEKDN